jgi:hypothetical protein
MQLTTTTKMGKKKELFAKYDFIDYKYGATIYLWHYFPTAALSTPFTTYLFHCFLLPKLSTT